MTETLPDDAAGIARAAALLRAGGLVAFGTETVYGLGADARNDLAVAAIFDAKGRSHFNPLIIHLPDAEAAFAEVSPSGAARVCSGSTAACVSTSAASPRRSAALNAARPPTSGAWPRPLTTRW